MLKQLVAAIMGGIMIAIGGCVYLNSVYTLTSTYFPLGYAVGAFFFAVALISICLKGYGLYTGRVGYLPDNLTRDEVCGLGMTLLGNVIGTFLIGALVSLTMQDGMALVAYSAVLSKLAAPWYLNLLRAVLCGVLMYLAVSIYKEKGSVIGILFCVPAFILAGFEHSVADMFYVAAAGFVGEWRCLGFLLLVIVGNAVGGMLLPLLSRLAQDKPACREDEEEPYEPCFTEDTAEEDAREEVASEVAE